MGEPSQTRALKMREELGYALRSLLRPRSTVLKEICFEGLPTDKTRLVADDVELIAEVELEGYTYCLVRREAKPEKTLTQREREVVRLVIDGFSNQRIADQLGISRYTVATHVRRIFRKLDISSRIALARMSISIK